METDRNALLITRAFLRKVITSETCEINDDDWWKRTMPLVYAMGRLDDLDLFKTAHNHQCALIAHGNLKEDSFKSVQQQAKILFEDMRKILRPWDNVVENKPNTDNYVEEFTRRFGDPNDPKIREKYEKAALAYKTKLEEDNQKKNSDNKKLEEFEKQVSENNKRRRRGKSK